MLSRFIVASVASAGVLLAQRIEPVNLRCEALDRPLGIDVVRPHLTWQIDSAAAGAMQTAFEVLVASRAEMLPRGADVWSSGRVQSSAEGVDYNGPALQSGRRYFWTVRVWGNGGRPVTAEPSWWEMGLLSSADWKARWIAWHDQEQVQNRSAGVKWIWYAGDSLAPRTTLTRYFRRVIAVPAAERTQLLAAGHATFRVAVNGADLGSHKFWGGFRSFDIDLQRGNNVVVIEATSDGPDAGVAALVQIPSGRVVTDSNWEAATSADGPWQPATVLGDDADERFGTLWPARPAALLKKQIRIAKAVKSARLRATALGSYCIFINGKRAGDDILAPGWTDYRKRVLYQTYDVTGLLASGDNSIRALLGDGWYGSALGWRGDRFNFGPPPPRFMAQIEVVYLDGSRDVFATDESWQAAPSAILRSELYGGEFYDARREEPSTWTRVDVLPAPASLRVEAESSPPIRVTQTLRPEKVDEPRPGIYVFDMAQNMVGWVRMKVNGPAGAQVTLRFAERLNPDGSIYTENLRGAEATDTYILRGGGEETFEPHFTYHGFRYVELTGYPKKPSLDSITGIVFHTAAPYSGQIFTGSNLVNQIWVNTMWGQRGNFESIPTDCPQRDERLGWMGDAGIFWRTALYNMDLQAFTHKWMRDVVDAQSPDGAFSDVSPRVVDTRDGAPAWGDAGIIIPWTAYQQYGDRRLVEENWPAMERWMAYVHEANPDLIWANRRNNDFGDWVPANSSTPKDLIATAYWAQDASMMADMARALGRDGDAARYKQLFNGIRDAFARKFVHDDGTIGSGSQACYALALHIGLVPEGLRKLAVDRLVADIESRGGHLSTGFLGTPHLMFALSENGRADVAYRLLLNDTYPSWGYTVQRGATTIWERWNGDTGDPSMNSYNHYAFGSVVEWLYREMAGIDTGPSAPGFEKIVIHPHPDPRIGHVRAEYNSVRGKIVSEWTYEDDGSVSYRVEVPANTAATVLLPQRDGKVTVEHVASGAHRFHVL